MKSAVSDASTATRSVLLKAVIALSYAHWEGFVKFSAQQYFNFIATKRLPFSQLNEQFYKNSFLASLNSLSQNRISIEERFALIDNILLSQGKRFKRVNPDLINTGSNLKFAVLKDICLICCVDFNNFHNEEDFIDRVLLKRRNAIAHGDDVTIGVEEVDELINKTTSLMRHFKNELENVVYLKSFMRQISVV
ncbi:MAG: MAE_28990/MAE_18760 family HEPN-like nuclease [Proteobacteria bacterium]|nr:MAE_28990/MAE_18760 family HEPN-like nuclease [Pseudomonadota bacterium]